MTFDGLRDLVQSLHRNKLKHLDAFDASKPKDALYLRLYNGIYEGHFKSAEEAAYALFGKDASDARYQHLVKQFAKRLTNLAFFIDVQKPQYNERTKAYFNCYRQLAAIYSIRGVGGRLASIEMMQDLLQQAMRYEFTNLCADLTRELCITISTVQPEKKRLIQHYETLNTNYEEKRYYERRAEQGSRLLLKYFSRSQAPNQEIVKELIVLWDELSPLVHKVDTLFFYSEVYQIGRFRYSLESNWIKALEVVEEGLRVFKSRKIMHRGTILAFLLNKITLYTQLKRADMAEVASLLEEARGITEENSSVWIKIQEVNFHYLLHVRQYEAALEVYQRTMQQGAVHNAIASLRDIWRLFGGYLQLLGAFKVLDPQKVEQAVGKLRLTAVVNTEIIGREKEGMNIPVLLLPILFRIADGKFETPADISEESLEKYRQRYLSNDTNRRSEAFLRLLQAIEMRSYDRPTANKRIKKAVQSLKSIPTHLARQWHDIEVIPYEDLWEIVDKHVP